MTIYVGVGDLAVCDIPGQQLKTMALGSCIAVLAFSKKSPVTGMLHFQLPESSINPNLAKEKPAMFADTGIAKLFREFSAKGVAPAEMIVKLVGGAQIMDPQNTFNIGKRNYLAAKKILWANRIWPAKEDVGGNHSRTVSVSIGKDIVELSSPGIPDWKI